MGVNLDAQAGQNSEYATAIHELADAFLHRVLQPWLYPDFFFKWTSYGRKFNANIRLVKELTKKILKEKKLDMLMRSKNGVNELFPNEGLGERKKRKAFLELLLEHHLKDPSFTEEDVRQEVDMFMFAGHDTTAMSLSWTLYCLGQNPEIQQRVQEELDDIFGDEIDRNIVREDLTRLKYLECVIKETLRLYPSAPFIARECEDSFTVLDHVVPAGSLCMILISELHQDPESFPEPEKFVPERFLPENSVGRHPYAYVPFSAGPRNCIGQKFAMIEEKIVLANILKKFRVTSLDPKDKVITKPNLTTKNAQPLRLRFEQRIL
ncbi:cytochrome P450 4C1 [Trichonephila clavata]|uniref:Cytochrome P450 4C1 n=1 Tax=Trichonephila clavata TaxID=2740835 RepID=A0A8X6FPY9_TRICU|nr:cytochrome P450 4C1 [Trichonephila clavata]